MIWDLRNPAPLILCSLRASLTEMREDNSILKVMDGGRGNMKPLLCIISPGMPHYWRFQWGPEKLPILLGPSALLASQGTTIIRVTISGFEELQLPISWHFQSWPPASGPSCWVVQSHSWCSSGYCHVCWLWSASPQPGSEGTSRERLSVNLKHIHIKRGNRIAINSEILNIT